MPFSYNHTLRVLKIGRIYVTTKFVLRAKLCQEPLFHGNLDDLKAVLKIECGLLSENLLCLNLIIYFGLEYMDEGLIDCWCTEAFNIIEIVLFWDANDFVSNHCMCIFRSILFKN